MTYGGKFVANPTFTTIVACKAKNLQHLIDEPITTLCIQKTHSKSRGGQKFQFS